MNPNAFTQEEKNEYCCFLNMESKDTMTADQVEYEAENNTLSIPTLNIYIELLLWNMFKSVSNSVDIFYDIVFEEKTIEEIYDQELIEGSGPGCHMEILKEYYQQFCYWSLFEEEDLDSPDNSKKLLKRGYKIVDTEEDILVLKKILLKKNISLQSISDMNVNDYKSSLHAFIELMCIQTNYDSDEVPQSLFVYHYEMFCNLFELEQLNLDLNTLKKEFYIDHCKKKISQLERSNKPTDPNTKPLTKSAKFYKLNLQYISDYLSLLKGSAFSEKISKNDQQKLIKKLIFPKGWVLMDLLLCLAIFLLIYWLYFFFEEHIESKVIMLSNFKKIPETERIRGFSPITVEGNLAMDSLYFPDDLLIKKILKYFLVYGFLLVSTVAMLIGKDTTNYYNTSRNQFYNYSNDGVAIMQWSLLYILVALFLWSICVYLVGTVVFSLIKIYALLPYVFSSLCFVVYLWIFVHRSRKNHSQLQEKVKSDLRSLLISRYVERLHHASSHHNEMQKMEQIREKSNHSSIQGTYEPLGDEEVYQTISQVMGELKDTCMLKDKWIRFVESVLLEDKQKIQSALIDIVEVEPISLPEGSLELLSQILAIDENMDNPELFNSIISSILLKIMMTNDKAFLKDLKLKELELLKTCDCPDEETLDKNLVCRGCRRVDLYEKNKTEIFKLALEKNTYIFLMLISMMDLIRKKNTSKILDILIDKILPEGLSGEEMETTSCLIKFAYQAFFDIDQSFNRLEWSKSINDIMMNFFPAEQNSIQVINLLDEGHNDNAFDVTMNFINSTDTINSVKRCITRRQFIVKQTNSISHFLSLAAILIGKEDSIPDKLLNDIHQFVNKNTYASISQDTLKILFNYILFSRETPRSIFNKIALNASKYFLDPEIASTIKDIKSIASGISKDIKTKDYQNLENSMIIQQIRKMMNLQPYEMMGFIYLLNDKTDNDEVSKFFHHIFAINNFQKYERTLLDLIDLAVSRDYLKIVRTFDRLKLKYHRIFAYLRGILGTGQFAERSTKEIMDIIQELPIEPHAIQETYEQLLKGLKKNNLSTFFQTVSPKTEVNQEVNLDNPKWRNLRILEVVWILNSDEKLTDVLVKFKSLFRELDDPLFFSFAIKVYTVLEYILKRKKLMMDSTIAKSRAVKVLADIIFTKVENVQKLVDLFVTEKMDDFIDAFCYFNEPCRAIVENNGRSLRNHIHYIDKSIKFLSSQIEFYSSNPIDSQQLGSGSSQTNRERIPTTDELGVIIIKKVMMPEIKLKHSQIMILLDSIIKKIFNYEDQIASHSVRIMKFFTSLFLYVLGDHNSDLGDYFEKEHKEQFIKTLINCRGSKSSAQRVNILFDDLFHLRKDLFGVSLYVYLILLLKGKLTRDEFNLKDQFESTLCKDIQVHPELFSYLDVYINKNKFKFKAMLMSVHWKILKQFSSHNSIKREDVDWDSLYDNILSVLADKQPNLSFFSELLKVPLSKLNFVYIFNNLRISSRVDKVLQEANSSSSFKEIVESINLDHSELIQILKICLNKAGFECLDSLLKKMHLQDSDQIDINMLMCLITIDSQLMIDPDETRNLFKRMNLYSKLFKKMRVDRDLGWALIRIVKGDMYSFKKFISVADLDSPSNHKKFLNLIVALCGCKNSPYNTINKESGIPVIEVVQRYNEMASDYRKKKENSREAAQIMIWELLGVHPVWGLIESEMGKKALYSSRFVPTSRVLSLTGTTNPLKMFQFYIMYSILNANLLGLEIFVNLSFFHSAYVALSSLRVVDNEEAEKSLAELQAYYKAIFQNVKLMFRKTLLQKKERSILNFEYTKTISDYWIFIDLTQDSGDEVVKHTFYETINPVLLNHWKQSYSRQHEITKKEEEEFAALDVSFKQKNLLSAFAGSSSQTNSEVIIHDQEKYENFLDSVVDCILLKMGEMNSAFHSPFTSADELARDVFDEGSVDSYNDIIENNLDISQEDEIDEDLGEKVVSQAGEEAEEDILKMEEEDTPEYQNIQEDVHIEEDKGTSQKFITDGIMEFCLYVYLIRLRKNTHNNYEEKIMDIDNDFNRIDNMFSTVEKLSVFNKNFSGFRKRKYMTLFSYSQGTIIGASKNHKQRYSLYAPELTLYANLMADKYEKVRVSGDYEYNFDKKEFIGRMHAIKRVLDYDMFNLSFYSPFTFTSFYNKNNQFKDKMYPSDTPTRTDPHQGDIYFSPCLMRRPAIKKEEWAQLATDRDNMAVYTSLLANIRPSLSLLSFFMIKKNLFAFTEDPLTWDFTTNRLRRRPNPKELTDPKTLNQKIDRLREQFFTKSAYTHSIKEMDVQAPTKTEFERNQERLAEYCFFLNDLAQGNYKVLSETRNIFSNNVHYTKYQSVYEAILRLHHLSKKYDAKNLQESLTVLAPYLTSDKNKLFIIVDYIMNTRDSASRKRCLTQPTLE